MSLLYVVLAVASLLALYALGVGLGRGKAAWKEQKRRRRQARSALWFTLLCLAALIAGVAIR